MCTGRCVLTSTIYCLLSNLECFVLHTSANYAPARSIVHFSSLFVLSPFFTSFFLLIFLFTLLSSSNSHSSILQLFFLPLSHHTFTQHIILLTLLQVVLVVGCHTEVSHVIDFSTTLLWLSVPHFTSPILCLCLCLCLCLYLYLYHSTYMLS
jgi:hypothetical protein